MTRLKARVGAANAQALLDNPAVTGDTWTLAQLIGAFTPSTGSAPSITSLNGHASHFQFQPPNADNGARAPLYTTTNFTGSTASQTNRLAFSMGCHAGLSVADSIVTSGASTLDWPQAFMQKGLGAFLGNTGFGFGDSIVVAYSEELNRLFAQRIAAGSSVGSALAAAKQAYYGQLGVFGVYDEKAMAEFTLYGLPMWRVSGPGMSFPPRSAQLAPAAPEPPVAKNTAVAPRAARGDPGSDDRARRRDVQRQPDEHAAHDWRLRSTGRARTACRSRSFVRSSQADRPADGHGGARRAASRS